MKYVVGEKVELIFTPTDIKTIEDLYHDSSITLSVKGSDAEGHPVRFKTSSEKLIPKIVIGTEIKLSAKVKNILKRGDVDIFYVKENSDA